MTASYAIQFNAIQFNSRRPPGASKRQRDQRSKTAWPNACSTSPSNEAGPAASLPSLSNQTNVARRGLTRGLRLLLWGVIFEDLRHRRLRGGAFLLHGGKKRIESFSHGRVRENGFAQHGVGKTGEHGHLHDGQDFAGFWTDHGKAKDPIVFG